MKQYQVTLYSTTGKYRPVSTIVKSEVEDKAEIRKKGIVKICQSRGWGLREINEYGYKLIKMREYNKEHIAQQNKERYEQIKKERGWV